MPPSSTYTQFSIVHASESTNRCLFSVMCLVPVDQWLSPCMDPCLAIHPVSRVANIGPSAAVRRVCEFKWMVTRSS